MPSKFEFQTYFGLDDDILKGYVEACQLSFEEDYYSDEQRDLVEKYRDVVVKGELYELYQQLISQNKSPFQALDELSEAFQIDSQEDSIVSDDSDAGDDNTGTTPKKSAPKKKKHLALFDLLKEGQKKTGKPITLSRSIELLGACGLPEKSEYSPEEVEKFLETCDLIINQGHSLGDVAAQNGVTVTSPYAWMGGMALDDASRSVSQMAQVGSKLDSQLTQVYNQAYFKRIQEMFENGEFQQAYQLERERLRTEQGSTVDVFDLQYQAAMNQLHQGNLKSIQQINSVPQLPPEE
jgi:hypothetical protein